MPEELAEIIKRAKATIEQMERIAAQASHLAEQAKTCLEKAKPQKNAAVLPPSPGKEPPEAP